MDNQKERLQYTKIPFSDPEVKSADGFELKENVIVYWTDEYSGPSGVVVSNFAIHDSVAGSPVVMIYDGEMCFLGSPDKFFVTKAGLYKFLAKKIEYSLVGEQNKVQHYRKLAEDIENHGSTFLESIIN